MAFVTECYYGIMRVAWVFPFGGNLISFFQCLKNSLSLSTGNLTKDLAMNVSNEITLEYMLLFNLQIKF